jgi:DNA-binding GntR family transcriptional regulator
MAERKPTATALTQVIYEGLREEITGGRLRPGAVLSRRRIAERYGSSYATVIEAMVRLENVGLIEAQSSQMARVRPLSVEMIQDTYVLREALETQAILRACEMATAEEIEDLYRRAEAVDANAPQHARSGKAPNPLGPVLHWEFHKRIAVLSGSGALVRELERIELLRRLHANWIHVPEMIDPPRYHSLLVDPIKEGNLLASVAVMREHVRKGLEKELRAYRLKISE